MLLIYFWKQVKYSKLLENWESFRNLLYFCRMRMDIPTVPCRGPVMQHDVNDVLVCVISKCRQGIGLLNLLSKYLPRHTLNEIYKLYILPHLDYGDVIYHILGNIVNIAKALF